MHISISHSYLVYLFKIHQIVPGSAIEATNSCHLVVIFEQSGIFDRRRVV